MDNKPKRVAVIGLDCAITHLIERHIEEGYLPTFKKLFENGVVAENSLTNYPTVTPPGWASIATGAWAGTHCITDFHIHTPGTGLDNNHIRAAFSSENCKAEYIWNALDKVGKKCVVLNYPGSWPGEMENGILIGGAGLSIGETRIDQPGLSFGAMVSHEMLVSTGVYPNAIHGEFEEAEGWKNLTDEAGDSPLEMEVPLNFPYADKELEPATWYVLAHENADGAYDRVTLSPAREYARAFCTLPVGQWSPKIFTTMKMKDGEETEVFFRCKLIELSNDAEEFRLLIGGLCATTGWSSPPELAAEISQASADGTFAITAGMRNLPVGWFGFDTYIELNEQYTQFLTDAAVYALVNRDWDLFYMHSHPTDWVYHAIINQMSPATQPDPEKRKAAWQTHLAIYETQDRMLARLLEIFDDDTLVVLVADHGATPDGPMFNPYDVLVPAGLCSEPKPLNLRQTSKYWYEEKMKEGMGMGIAPDPATSKAIPQREIYIYINLKGRDPGGIVEPKDYEKVQREIIDALYDYRDPKTGKRPIALALSKQDARILGLYGDYVGDVIYALHPEFGSQHGQILPTGEWGDGSLRGLLTFTGTGTKKGFRLKRNVWLTDIVPTICYLMDWPLPEQAEGAILYQIFENHDFKRNQIETLKQQLLEMEKQMA